MGPLTYHLTGLAGVRAALARETLGRACAPKRRYGTEASAATIIAAMVARGRGPRPGFALQPYRCRVCGDFHVGNTRLGSPAADGSVGTVSLEAPQARPPGGPNRQSRRRSSRRLPPCPPPSRRPTRRDDPHAPETSDDP